MIVDCHGDQRTMKSSWLADWAATYSGGSRAALFPSLSGGHLWHCGVRSGSALEHPKAGQNQATRSQLPVGRRTLVVDPMRSSDAMTQRREPTDEFPRGDDAESAAHQPG